MPKIHPLANVHRDAQLADDVEVGAFTVIGEHVKIGAGTVIGPHVVLTGHTTLGENNRVFQFASIGEISQDKKYQGEKVTTTIGDNNTFREYVSVHAGTVQDRGDTLIGNGNLILAYTHVAHDCVLGNNIVISNTVQLAGHVHVEDYVVMGGLCGIHQFCRIGAHAMVGGGSMLVQDVPPYVTVSGYPAKPVTINSEGLKRRGFTSETIMSLKRAYKTLYRNGLSLSAAIDQLRADAENEPALLALVTFLEVEGRGIAR
ncbi:MAG: acyl-ACP--UDP-N-acetylglucosamine O-acyltransferase [Burkholderiales bacterium]|jgi:UDP-N-acetylglucosamine acyltransferase|nr:acyl-ACP--UDP-N-acetylglucosamine O-acyltransferase [Burkholderiales bacterium]